MKERYSIQTPNVGKGGFGTISKGVDIDLDRPVAIKTLDPALKSASDQDKERFKREARTLAKLSHPSIPAIYDIDFSKEKLNIIFQFIDGDTLEKLIHHIDPNTDDNIKYSVTEIRPWFEQIASAVQHAHDNHIIHRDIKPANIIISRDRKHCYLVDFGLALNKNDLERITKSGIGIGTTGYMSQEQERGLNPDSLDDIFSLGVCLYESLCGHRPSASGYEPLNHKDETIPPAIDDLVQSCIADRQSRVKTALAFSDRLLATHQQHIQLSQILATGQLHEIIDAIRSMSPQEFVKLPIGQKSLIFSKTLDVASSKDVKLVAAQSQFLATMSTLAVYSLPDDYSPIVQHALKCAFDKYDGIWEGDTRVKQALFDAASKLQEDNHAVFVKDLLDWMKLSGNISETRKPWYYHNTRTLISILLANTNCNELCAKQLTQTLNEVNRIHRELQSQSQN